MTDQVTCPPIYIEEWALLVDKNDPLTFRENQTEPKKLQILHAYFFTCVL